MKDVTFGVKVPEGFRDQINELMKDSGLVGREFMQQLLDSYLLDQNKQEVPEMAEEIKELQALTHRINEMYLYLGTRFQNSASLNEKEKKNMDEAIKSSKLSFEEKVRAYKEAAENTKISVEEKVTVLQQELDKTKQANKKLTEQLMEISDYNENFKELNSQYKNQITLLSKDIEKAEPLKMENTKLLGTNHKLQETNDNLASDLWFSKRENESLREEIQKNKKEYERYISHLKDQHHLEKQTTVLELQLEHQKNVEVLNSKMATMQEEYHEKLKQLLLQVEPPQKEKGE